MIFYLTKKTYVQCHMDSIHTLEKIINFTLDVDRSNGWLNHNFRCSKMYFGMTALEIDTIWIVILGNLF